MIKLLNGDCIKLMSSVEKVRYLLTDIPYEVVSRKDNGLRNLNKGAADKKTFNLDEFLECIYDKADIFTIFCGNEQYSIIYDWFYSKQKEHKGTVRQIVWAKTNPSPMNGEYVYLSGTENAVWFKKSNTGKLNTKCKKNWFVYPIGRSKLHPTEKNINLLIDLIDDNTNIGDTVLDCCMGSGSTGIACINTNRNFIGLEIDETYFNIAKDRLEKAVNK